MAESFENSGKVSFRHRRSVNLMGLFFCFYCAKNFLVQNECIFLKFFSFTMFTFMKIEQNYIFLLINGNCEDLRGKKPKIIFRKNHTREDEHDSNRYDTKH